MATFPARRDIYLDVVRRIAPQVDTLFIALNEYDAIPAELAAFGNVMPVIPSRDLKDLGKFAFPAEPDDVVFTVDDDILFPACYVARTLDRAAEIGLERNILSYCGNAFVHKKRLGRNGWRNLHFFKPCDAHTGVNVVGTGTCCMLGRNMPDLDQLAGSEGFVDIRFSASRTLAGLDMWVLSRPDPYLLRNLPEHLQASSLYNTVARAGLPAVHAETMALIRLGAANAGTRWVAKG